MALPSVQTIIATKWACSNAFQRWRRHPTGPQIRLCNVYLRFLTRRRNRSISSKFETVTEAAGRNMIDVETLARRREIHLYTPSTMATIRLSYCDECPCQLTVCSVVLYAKRTDSEAMMNCAFKSFSESIVSDFRWLVLLFIVCLFVVVPTARRHSSAWCLSRERQMS